MSNSKENWPGVAASTVREWVYIERRPGESSESIIEHIGRFLSDASESERPKEGGILDEGFALADPNGNQFQAFSYRGDLANWRRGIDAFSSVQRRRTARIAVGRFIAGDAVYALDECVEL